MRLQRLTAPLAAISVVLLASCGGSDTGDADPAGTATTTDAAETAPTSDAGLDKPAVSIPAEQPVELVITDLVQGTGRAAVEGDTLLVHYVGVRSADGTEFDNSYDRGQPLPVTLGLGGVIPGWEQGLLGATGGGRRQLDIPADLAYGDQPQGDVIQPGDALTFVVDVLVVVPPSDLDDAPTAAAPTSTGATALSTEDLVVGDGEPVVEGSTAFVEIVAYRGDTAEEINTTWGNGGPVSLTVSPEGTLPGLYEGLLGMKVGGRRLMTMPPSEAFGEGGNADISLPAATDLVLVVDVVALY